LLSSTGMAELQTFCGKLNIKILDINDLTLAPGDELPMIIAKRELHSWSNDEYVNPASASDIFRMMECVAAQRNTRLFYLAI